MTNSQHRITQIVARRVWDSRGRPTVEAEVHAAAGACGKADGTVVGRAIVPAGASKGRREALELRDGGAAFGGLDVQAALANIRGDMARALIGQPLDDQEAIDRLLVDLDGTPNKQRLGANATLAVSMAAAHAAAAAHGVPLHRHLARRCGIEPTLLPLPQIQIFGGGAHAARRVDVQDFMVQCLGATSFAQALEWAAEVYRAAGQALRERGSHHGVADEGGWWPDFESNEQALGALVAAIERAGFEPGRQVSIALDVAASDFGRHGRYRLGLEQRELGSDELIELLLRWCERYPIASIEDPLAEDDAAAFARFTQAVGSRVQVVGDDLLVSSAERLREAAALGAANAVLLKPNQRGTLSETLQCWAAARDAGYAGIVSARSGESEDTTIVELSIGWGVGQLKVGSFARSERMAKWNEALRIEERLGVRARFAGAAVLGRNPRVQPAGAGAVAPTGAGGAAPTGAGGAAARAPGATGP
jgi:enolase